MEKGHPRGDGSLFYHRLKAEEEKGCKGGHGKKWLVEEDKPKKCLYLKLLPECDDAAIVILDQMCCSAEKEKRKATHLYVLTLCIVASGKPSIPQTTRLLFTLQPRSHTCLHLPACFTSTTPSVTRVFLLVAMRMGRRRTSSICTLLCPFGRRHHTDGYTLF